MKHSFLFISLFLALTLVLCACSKSQISSDEYYGGESMNAEILSEIAESVFNESKKDSENGAGNSESESKHDGVYYWTNSGSVYHKWADCGHLKNSSEILSGSHDDALLAGKQKLCSTCEERN